MNLSPKQKRKKAPTKLPLLRQVYIAVGRSSSCDYLYWSLCDVVDAVL